MNLRELSVRIAPYARAVIPKGSVAYRALRSLRRRYMLYGDDPVELVVRAFADHVPDVFFVQIGSNDGDQLDPLRPSIERRGLRGIMVEPVPYVFRRLEQNYGGVPGIALENVAIADRDGSMPFHHLREAAPGEELPRIYDALGSFNRDVVLKHAHLVPDIEQRMVTTDVEVMRFDSLLAKHGVERIDLLHIDTEGYDYEVLKTVDFHRWAIPLVVFEVEHLSAADRKACSEMLAGYGYRCFSCGLDTVALLESAAKTLPEGFLREFERQSERCGGGS